MNYTNKRISPIEIGMLIGEVTLFAIITLYLSWYFIFLFGLIVLALTNLNKSKISFLAAQKNIIRTFILLIIPYLVVTKLYYPIEFLPTPFYSIGFLFGVSLVSVNSNVVLRRIEIKLGTIKEIFSVKKNVILIPLLFVLYLIEALNHRAYVSGIMLSILSLIVAYMALDEKENQVIAIAYFFSTVFLFLSFV